MIVKTQLILLLLLFIHTIGLNQESYHLSIKLEGIESDTFYLARYHTDKILIADTGSNDQGAAIFSGSQKLPEGIYLLANNKKEKLAEFLVDGTQNFSIMLFADGRKAEVTGSEENSWFFDHIDLSSYVFKHSDSLRQLLEEKPVEEQEKLKSKIAVLTDSLIHFRKTVINSNPEALFSKILMAMEEPVIPESIKNDQQAAYRFYKNNYWKEFDLSDERLLNTPLLPRKLETYFNQLVLPVADSVIKEVDFLLAKAEGSQKTIDYLAWHFVSEYQTPKIMGLDKVFVHLADSYFITGKVENLSASILEKIMERANKIRPGMIGNQAPDLWLIDTSGDYRSFKEIDAAYTVLAFWDQTCSHCKKELETLSKLYNKRQLDLEVYSINTTTDFDGWKHYLQEKKYDWINVNGTRSIAGDFHELYDIYSVPVLYLLDKQKKIIARRFSAEQLEEIIRNHKQ